MTQTASPSISRPPRIASADATRVAVSTVIFTLRREPGADRASVVLPLVRRTRDPHEGLWALPGGWLDAAESLDAAAARTLAETTGLAPSYLEQLYAFGAVDRSPDGRVVSIVYWALVRSDEVAAATVDDENVRWFDADDLPAARLRPQRDRRVRALAAAQQARVQPHRARASSATSSPSPSCARCTRPCSAGRLDPANFRRQVEASGHLVPTDQLPHGHATAPPRLYRYNQDVELADRGPLVAALTSESSTP